jgi:hypothetical protein
MRIRSFAGAFALVLSAATAATAAGPGGPSMPSGYIDVHGGVLSGSENDYNPDGSLTFQATTPGGAIRAALPVTPDFSLQGDLWFNGDNFQGSAASSTSAGGVGAHATWHTPGGDQLGVLVSVGSDGNWDSGTFSNVGVEAVHLSGNWRFYGQIGRTQGISGDAASFADSDVYASVAADYFINPNLFVSANLGADSSSDNTSRFDNEMSWGGKIEFKPNGFPASFYLAYQGYSYRDTVTGSSFHDEGVAHTFMAGLRIPFGQDSLQDLQSTVGLSDENPSFGDFVNR